MYRKSILKNGIRVVSHQMQERGSVSIGILIGVGGRHEAAQVKGAAHYIEHVVFKGSAKYTCAEIKENIEGVGGSLNAFTSEETTCFYAKVPVKHAAHAFDVLADLVWAPALRSKDIESERSVIIEEIKMYYDLPQYHVVELLEALVWPDHPLGGGIAGTAASVGGMTSRDLRKFYAAHYIPNNIVVAAAGDMLHGHLVELVRRRSEKLLLGHPEVAVPVTARQMAPRVSYCEKPIEQMYVALGVPGVSFHSPDRYAVALLNIILGGNMSSRLFNEIREKRGLAYSISTATKQLSDTGLFLVRAGVEGQKTIQAIELILKEFKAMKTNGVTPAELRRAKEYLIGQSVLALEDTMEHMLWIGESTLMRDHIRTIEETIQAVKKVRLDDIREIARAVLAPERMNLAIVGPLSGPQRHRLSSLLGVK